MKKTHCAKCKVKLDATVYNRIAYCSKCNVSDFYKYPATEDSRCCGDKLKPKNK